MLRSIGEQSGEEKEGYGGKDLQKRKGDGILIKITLNVSSITSV